MKRPASAGHRAGNDIASVPTPPAGGATERLALPKTVHPPDREARFTRVFDLHYHRILGYARRRVGPDDAQDIVAETFAVAWRRFDDLPDGEQSLYWLYGTARRVVANHRRGEARRANLKNAIASNPALLPAASSSEEAERLARALARLDDRDRELLLLAAWEGLDAAAIAAVLGCSRNAARIRLHRARRRFAQALDEPVKHAAVDGHIASVGGRAALDLEEC
jgi:RNA polymerase sigma-70 factor (ECF subfamily)